MCKKKFSSPLSITLGKRKIEALINAGVSAAEKKLIGYEDDKSYENTINGAKTYARNEVANLKRDMTDNFASKEYVENEIATFDFIKVVTKLPETGLENRFYLVPKQGTETQNLFDEWVWVNRGTEEAPDWDWEWISTQKLEVDLTAYATKDFVGSRIENLVGEEETDDEEDRTIEGTRKYAESLIDYKIHDQNYLSMETAPFEIPFGTHICAVSNVEKFSPDGSSGGIFTSSKVHSSLMAEETYKSYDSGAKYERSAGSDMTWSAWKRTASIDDVNEASNQSKTLLELWYGIGSVYLSFNYVNPAELLGFGEWQLIENRFLIGAGDAYEAGDIGGEETVTLSEKQVPKVEGRITLHNGMVATNVHKVEGCFSPDVTREKYIAQGDGTAGASSVGQIKFSNGGDNEAHNNMPPYIAVYMWRRIA